MPRSSYAWRGSEALWITVAGWASAAKELLGESHVITTDAIYAPEQVWDFPRSTLTSSGSRGVTRFFPEPLVTAIKDYRLYQAQKKFIAKDMPAITGNVKFVWEQHDLFTGYGKKLADAFHVPLITYVHAPTVWEARKWGVKRNLTGGWLTRIETKNLNKSDLVLCVSEEVKNELIRMGVTASKVYVSPMSVAAERFDVAESEIKKLRNSLGIANRKVFGWTGSFRGFHGLEDLIRLFARVVENDPNAILMLVGDGKERTRIETLSKELGIQDHLIFTGRKNFSEIPLYVGCFDFAVLSAARNTEFHYSPLKLREYLAAGKPTLAPEVGEIPIHFKHGQHLHLFDLNDAEDQLDGFISFIQKPDYTRMLAQKGKEHIEKTCTWKVELKKAIERLSLAG